MFINNKIETQINKIKMLKLNFVLVRKHSGMESNNKIQVYYLIHLEKYYWDNFSTFTFSIQKKLKIKSLGYLLRSNSLKIWIKPAHMEYIKVF